MHAIDLAAAARRLEQAWSPEVIARVDGHLIKVALLDGEFHWHQHRDHDEAFLVLEGELEIDLPEGTQRLRAGQLLVVPAGVEHRPRATQPCRVALYESERVVAAGDPA